MSIDWVKSGLSQWIQMLEFLLLGIEVGIKNLVYTFVNIQALKDMLCDFPTENSRFLTVPKA